jgi:hypothetical protein
MADTINEGATPEADAPATGAVPWHFWAVVAVALLWNGYGAWDYTSYQLGMATVDPAMQAELDAAPVWATAGWALGVWGSFVGAVLMLLRSRHATTAFAVSLIAAIVSFAWQFSAGIVPTPILPLVILAAVAFFWWYAARMRDEGALR